MAEKSAEDYETVPWKFALYTLSENCEFGASRNKHLRDRLVVGIRHKELSKRM